MYCSSSPSGISFPILSIQTIMVGELNLNEISSKLSKEWQNVNRCRPVSQPQWSCEVSSPTCSISFPITCGQVNVTTHCALLNYRGDQNIVSKHKFCIFNCHNSRTQSVYCLDGKFLSFLRSLMVNVSGSVGYTHHIGRFIGDPSTRVWFAAVTISSE